MVCVKSVLSEKFDSIVDATCKYPRLCWMKFTIKDTDIIPFS